MRSGFRVWIDGNPVDEIFDLGYSPDRIAFLELQKQHGDNVVATCPDGCVLVLRKAHRRQGAFVEVTLTHTPGQRDQCPHAKAENEGPQHQELKNLLRQLGERLGQDPQLECVEVSDEEPTAMRIDVVWRKANIAWEVDVTPKSLGRTLVRSGREESAGYEHSIAVLPRSKKRVFQPVVKALEVNTGFKKNRFAAFVRPVYRQRVDPDTYQLLWEAIPLGVERFSRGLLAGQLDWREISARRRGWCIALTEEELMSASALRAQKAEQVSLKQRASDAHRKRSELEYQLRRTERQHEHRTSDRDRVASSLGKLGLTSDGTKSPPPYGADPCRAFDEFLVVLRRLETHRPWWKRVLLEPALRSVNVRPRIDQAIIEAHSLGEQAVHLLQDEISSLQEQIDSETARGETLAAASEEKELALAAACRRLGNFPWAQGRIRRY